jgi:hypothetical protein
MIEGPQAHVVEWFGATHPLHACIEPHPHGYLCAECVRVEVGSIISSWRAWREDNPAIDVKRRRYHALALE